MMANWRYLEIKANKAIQQHYLRRYQQQNPHWREEGVLRQGILRLPLTRHVASGLLGGGLIFSWLLFILGGSPLFLIIEGVILWGLIGLMFLLYFERSLRNPTLQQQALAQQKQTHLPIFRLSDLHDKTLQAKLLKALITWGLIDETIRTMPTLMAQRFNPTYADVTMWLENLFMVTQRLDKQRLLAAKNHEWQGLPQRIKQTRSQRRYVENSENQAHLTAVLSQQETQWAMIEQLQAQWKQADYQLEQTVSALATIHSQLLLLQQKKSTETSPKVPTIQQLHAEVTEQVERLQDLTMAMDEVYHARH